MDSDLAFHQAIVDWNREIHKRLGPSAFAGDSQLIGTASWKIKFAEYIWEKALASQKGVEST